MIQPVVALWVRPGGVKMVTCRALVCARAISFFFFVLQILLSSHGSLTQNEITVTVWVGTAALRLPVANGLLSDRDSRAPKCKKKDGKKPKFAD